MHCWQSVRSLTLCLLLCCLAPFAGNLHAAGIETKQASLLPTEDGFELTADFAIDFPPALEAAVARGLTLYFVVEFELNRPRWYWLDERSVRQTQTWRLSYHALTRQYRLGSGALLQSFANLGDALRVISRLRGWQVFERKDVRAGERYQASLRLTHDLSQLPKPFQVNAIGNREWDLSSPWHSFAFVPGSAAAGGATAESR